MKNAALILPILLVLGSACAEGGGGPASSQPATAAGLSAEELGVVGAEIRRSPERAAQILAERGLDEERFEEAIREVSSDPEASARYHHAFQQAGGTAARP